MHRHVSYLKMLLKYIKNFFRKDKMAAEQNTGAPRAHKLEIQVYEADWEKADSNNGQPIWKPVRGDPQLDGGRPTIIEVMDKKEFAELQQQYKMCDQRFKVIREIDPFPWDGQQKSEPAKPAAEQAKQEVVQPVKTAESANVDRVAPTPRPPIVAAAPKKVKIVTIGDVEVKYDGDKVYQKQWIKLSVNEAANFRVVNDSNNKIFSLAGKHIEAKKWVQVEETAENDDDAVESILKG